MTTLRRADGLQFIIQPYRELFNSERTSILKRKIRLLAKRYGDNIRIFKTNENRFEIVFSRDSGFLLGKTVWLALNQPDNLIYCEALPERNQALLVVVRDGIVFLDAKMSYTNLIEEFISLSISDEKYAIYIFGDVPLAESSATNKFAFSEKNIKSFQILSDSLLDRLEVKEEAQLQPLALALASPYLGKVKVVPIVLGIAIIIAMVVAWNIFKAAPAVTVPKIQLSQINPQSGPYQKYFQSLTTPDPQKEMLELVFMTHLVHNLPNWEISKVTLADNQYTIQLTSPKNNGSITQVQSWAELNNINMTLQENNIILKLPSALANQTPFTAIYPLQQVLGLMIDNINQILSAKSVTFSDVTNYDHYQAVNATIKFSKIYPGMLILIGQELSRLPVAISAINVTPDNNLFSGNIALKVLGD
jgi:hypothetical protein